MQIEISHWKTVDSLSSKELGGRTKQKSPADKSNYGTMALKSRDFFTTKKIEIKHLSRLPAFNLFLLSCFLTYSLLTFYQRSFIIIFQR